MKCKKNKNKWRVNYKLKCRENWCCTFIIDHRSWSESLGCYYLQLQTMTLLIGDCHNMPRYNLYFHDLEEDQEWILVAHLWIYWALVTNAEQGKFTDQPGRLIHACVCGMRVFIIHKFCWCIFEWYLCYLHPMRAELQFDNELSVQIMICLIIILRNEPFLCRLFPAQCRSLPPSK